MSNLPGNPHYKPILESISDFGEYTISAEGLTDATIVWQGLADQAQATLALACEQRLATLATMFNLPDGSAIPGVDYAEAARQLSEGLGMRAEK